ncbi:hypothetical protein [Leptolyngbya ohadii]|uniref:hypothetical protein n=1 Tax=Leptolyngbya ohadii TaxID=1962290 RepID=UPI000B59A865|nr:hypothetical protein [Leptolyngbya ohadii]
MQVIVFGNYIFAKTIAIILTDRGYRVACFCNRITDDDKYGAGIQRSADSYNFELYIGHKDEHLKQLENFNPVFAISAAYKYLIPVENLKFPVYGVHFGGLYGHDSIRGKSSSVWYRLRQIKKSTIALYRMSADEFDVGSVINTVTFQLGDIKDDPYKQVDSYEELLQPLLDSSNTDIYPKSSIDKLASYFPKATINRYSKKYFDESEAAVFRNVQFEENEENVDIEIDDKKYIFDDLNECYFYRAKGEKNDTNIIYLHGFGSVFSKTLQNNKLVKLSSLLGQSIIAPVLKGLNGLDCDGTQKSVEVIEQFHKIFSFANENESIVVCTSIACLIASDILRFYKNIKHIIFVTPIVELLKASFDPAITNFLTSDEYMAHYVNLESKHLSGYKISTELLNYLSGISMLDSLREYSSNYQVIFSRHDDFIDAAYWRSKFIDMGANINSVNVIDGEHPFRSPLQLYYLACQIRKIVK